MRIYANSIIEPEKQSDDIAQLASRYIYLMHGGSPEDYEEFDSDDRQGIYTTYYSSMHMAIHELLDGLTKILKVK